MQRAQRQQAGRERTREGDCSASEKKKAKWGIDIKKVCASWNGFPPFNTVTALFPSASYIQPHPNLMLAKYPNSASRIDRPLPVRWRLYPRKSPPSACHKSTSLKRRTSSQVLAVYSACSCRVISRTTAGGTVGVNKNRCCKVVYLTFRRYGGNKVIGEWAV